jgi:hypothetical protein
MCEMRVNGKNSTIVDDGSWSDEVRVLEIIEFFLCSLF